MKYQFPRHLFVPLLIYDAVTESSTPPPPPPSESHTVKVKIQPLVDYVESIIQYSKSDIVQGITQVSTFTLVTAGKGQLIVNGDVNIKQTLDAKATATSIINDTIINRLQTELPDLFANVVVSGPTTAQDPQLWMSLQTKIRDNITQLNYASIVQNTFDMNKAKIYVRGRLEVDSVDIQQGIATKVVAVNLIQSIIDNVVELSASDGTEKPPQQGVSVVGLIAAALSSLCSCFICIMILVLLLKNKK